MELEEAKEYLRKLNDLIFSWSLKEKCELNKAIETVLQALDNSITKEKVEKYLKEEQERFNTYKKESKTNENLKLGMYKHLGAKNMCEQILGIERNIATLD